VHLGALKGLSMEKWLCWGALGISGSLLILFVLDMFMGIPYGGIGAFINIVGILGCGLCGYLAWEAFRDLR
jgi:hypothetical protein